MKKILLSEVLELTVPERIQLAQDIGDTIAELPDTFILSDLQKKELDQRIEAHRQHPEESIPWEEVRQRIGL